MEELLEKERWQIGSYLALAEKQLVPEVVRKVRDK